jgi:hypothetical protein
MAYREFFDEGGQTWRVYEVRPGEGGRVVSAQLAGGWLTFESSAEKRRLAPIPAGWFELPEDSLLSLCGEAMFVRERGESGIWPRFDPQPDAR